MPCLSHSGADFATPSALPHHSPDLPLLPQDLDLSVSFDWSSKTVTGEMGVTLLATRDGARSLSLDAVDFATIEALDEDGAGITTRYDGRHLDVSWPEGSPRGSTRRLRVRWTVSQPVTGLVWAPVGTADFVASDHESERARHWLPVIDHPAVRTQVTWRLRAPADMEALGNGAWVSTTDHGDGTKTTVWRLSERCPSYLLCLAVGHFTRVDLPAHEGFGKRVPIALFASSNHTPDTLVRTWEKTTAMMDWMTAKLDAPFPFPKYFQFAVPGIGGAMENISLTSWDDVFLFESAQEATWRLRADAVNLHEMAHSYFGDSLVVRDFSHVWLKESWASYMESCWVEDHLGRNEQLRYLSEESRDYRKEAADRYVRPIVTRRFDSSWDMYDQHLYPGGAYRLHMLRRLIGDEAFWRGVRAYVARHTGALVETDDFRRAMEEASGRSLTRFFELWFHQPGHPIVKASWSWDATKHHGTLGIEQTQVDEKKGIGLFEFAVPVWFEHQDGSWTKGEVRIDRARHEATYKWPDAPLQVLLDPEGDVLATWDFSPGRELSLRALQHGPTPNSRAQAAGALARSGQRAAIAALDEARRTEPFWGVRIEIARALGESATAQAMEILARWLVEESDERLILVLADACSGLRDEAVAAALVEALRKAFSSFTRAGLSKALGAQRGDAVVPALAAELDKERASFWGHSERGALWGLGESRSEKAAPILLAAATSPRRRQERMAAIDGLGSLARWLPAAKKGPIQDTLGDLLRDPDYGTRQAAARALCAAGEPPIAAIERMLRTLADQEVPRLRKAIAAARSTAEGAPVEKLQKRVEELEEKVRKLQAAAEQGAKG